MTVFRELFVEVPMALLTLWPSIREIGKRFGWEVLEWHRSSMDCRTIVHVRLPCGHFGRFTFHDEHTAFFSRAPREFVDYVWSVLEEAPLRKCTCVAFVPPIPCNHGVCE